MVKNINILHTVYLPCGNSAVFEQEIVAYRCTKCNAIVNSPEQPTDCTVQMEKWQVLEKLGGKGWDFIKGKQEDV